MAESPPVLRGGFRPFFLAGALWAVAALALWMASLAGAITLPTQMPPLAWHRHEMLFGFAGAALAGFLLTAIPNWTGRLPIAGPQLLGLVSWWLAGRLAVLTSATTPQAFAATVDVSFYLGLALLGAREVLAAKNRNVPIVALVLLFGAADVLDHAAAAGLLADEGTGARAGIALVVVMISLIGGRIIPSFTRNWLAKRGARHALPTQPTRFDLCVIALTAMTLLPWAAGAAGVAAGWSLLVAGLAQLVRLARWRGYRTFADPLVLVLHVGYAWVPIGLALLGSSMIAPGVPVSAAVHALAAGAIGTMILAVMTRASLGHTGRALRAGPGTAAIYLLVTLGAALRVSASLAWIDYGWGLDAAAASWGGAFLLFLALYGPILFRPRAGEGA